MASIPGRGEGHPSATQEQDVTLEHQVPQREQPQEFEGFASECTQKGQSKQKSLQQQKSLPGFWEKSSVEPALHEPVHHKQEKKKTQTMPHEELDIELKQKLKVSLPFPTQPEVSNLKRIIKLISNCYQLKVPSGNIYHYDVDIALKRHPPNEAKRNMYHFGSTKRNREVMYLLVETNQHFSGLFPAYDGRKNLYTRKPLECNLPLKCEIITPNENSGNHDVPHDLKHYVFDVQIKPVVNKNTNSYAINLDSIHDYFEKKANHVPQETILAIGTILLHGPYLRYIPIGYNFFYPPNPEDLHPLGEGRAIWFGYHQSLQLGEWKPMVTLDIKVTTFYKKCPVLNYIAEFMNTTVEDLHKLPHLSDADVRRITGELKNIRIETNHQRKKREYRIIRLCSNSTSCLIALKNNDNTAKITVAEFFRRQFKVELKFPHLPLLQVNPENKMIYLPIEVCDVIEGQHCRKKLHGQQMADMVKFSTLPPHERFNKIKDIITNKATFNYDKHMQAFSFEVSSEPLSLEGRVLDAPNVRYKDGAQIRPRDGSWNMREIKFFRGAEINSWVLLSFAVPRVCTEGHLDKFAQLLVKIGEENGISIRQPSHIEIVDSRSYDAERLLATMKEKYKADLAVIVIPGRNNYIYGDIKRAEIVVGLTTQCIKDENISGRKCSPQLVSNLCQKINAKMGGINNSLTPGETPPVLRKPVIIIGAYVIHPNSPHVITSLAACVGSLDCYPSRYAVTYQAQTNIDRSRSATEIILTLKEMVLELLIAFYQHTNGKRPEKIIFYRNGVGEGQLEKVKDHEVKCIRDACRNLSEDYMPGITFIVVQKGHHKCFMPDDPKVGVGKMKNIPPGTIIDTTVTHPVNLDFFLCSHFGLQGTSRPSHYIVIEDDNMFTANDIQKLTYYLCHTYVRCTKSTSTPAPVRYARLAASRALQYLSSQMEQSNTSSDTSGDYDSLSPAVMGAIKLTDNLKNTMFYV